MEQDVPQEERAETESVPVSVSAERYVHCRLTLETYSLTVVIATASAISPSPLIFTLITNWS